MSLKKDPVCGMHVEAHRPTSTSTYQGQQYYFCSEACKSAFDRNPAAYIARASREET